MCQTFINNSYFVKNQEKLIAHLWNFVWKREVLHNSLTSNECSNKLALFFLANDSRGIQKDDFPQ